MPSKILRRSGNAVVQYCDQLLGWRPSSIFIVGVGGHHEEVVVMKESWPDARFTGFEPQPDSYAGMESSFPGRLFPYAVSRVSKKGILYSKPNWKDGSSLKTPNEDYGRKNEIRVEITSLDEMLPLLSNGNQRTGLLWLDCEGSEYDALFGAKQFINQIAMINVEMTCRPRGEDWGSPIGIDALLRGYGFLQCWNHTIRPSRGQYDAIYVHRSIFKIDACAIPLSIREWEDV